MASEACKQELNAQLQALNARVRMIEENVQALIQVNIINTVKTIAGFIASGMAAGAALMSADPTLAMVILGVDSWERVIEALKGGDIEKILLSIVMKKLALPAYGQQVVDGLTQKINDSITNLSNQIDLAIQQHLPMEQIRELEAQKARLQNNLDSIADFINASNDMSLCKAARGVIGFK